MLLDDLFHLMHSGYVLACGIAEPRNSPGVPPIVPFRFRTVEPSWLLQVRVEPLGVLFQVETLKARKFVPVEQ